MGKKQYQVLRRIQRMNEEILNIVHMWELQRAIFRKRKKPRGRAVRRIRWNEEYFMDLARRENAFRKEYRMSEEAFNALHDILKPHLEVNTVKADAAMGNDKRRRISTRSRLGAALIMLGGGRAMESMRTHGLGEKTVYENFRRVIRAINSCEQLAIKCDNSIEALEKRAAEFSLLSSVPELFQFCTGANVHFQEQYYHHN